MSLAPVASRALKSLLRFYSHFGAGFFAGCAFTGFLIGMGGLG